MSAKFDGAGVYLAVLHDPCYTTIQPSENRIVLSLQPTMNHTISLNTAFHRILCMFCFPRQFFTSSTSYKDTAFTDKGVMDWKNIRKKLDEHSSTNSHMDCMVRWNEYKNSQKKGSITTQMSKSHEDAVAENWKYAEKRTEALLFLARQGLAPGHDESHGSMNRGNFLELCSLLETYDLKFAERLDRHLNLTNHESQNKLPTIAAHQLHRNNIE